MEKKSYNRSNYEYIYLKKGIKNSDLELFLAVIIMMGIHNLPSMHSYLENNIVFANRIPEIFSRDYFLLWLKVLHLPEEYSIVGANKINDIEDNYENESSIEEEEDIYKNEPRHKTEFYINTIIKNSKNYYIIGKNVTIDEKMIFFRGRSLRWFYLPAKPHKWGFKIHSFVDSRTHYLYDMILDPCKFYKNLISPDDNKNFAYQIVMTLINRLPGKGYHIFCHSWYGSIDLIKNLSEKGCEIITCLRENTKKFT